MSDAREGISFVSSAGDNMTVLGKNYMQVIVRGSDPLDYSMTFIGPGNIVVMGKWEGRKVAVVDPPFADLVEDSSDV